MHVLHSLWDTKAFYIWAESSSLPLTSGSSMAKRTARDPPPHPFALPATDLLNHIHKNGGRESKLSLRLPSGKKGPLPSPWLLREDHSPEKPELLGAFTVPALAYEPGPAIDLLLDMSPHSRQGEVYADSMLFWSQLSLFALELVCREKFVPAVQSGHACWKAEISEPDLNRLDILVKSMPYSCLGLSPAPGIATSPRALVASFLDRATDCIVHRSLKNARLLPPRRGRRPSVVPLAEQFLAALTSEKGAIEADTKELAAFTHELDSWVAQLQPKPDDMPFRTCFRLEAPAGDGETWKLGFFLQARDDRSLLIPAEEVWRAKSEALTFLKKRLRNPQEQLLADLGKAMRVLPELDRSLQKARPKCLEMQTEEAYSFLRQSAPLLEQNGFGVMLPSWWERPGSRLGIKLELLDAPKKEGQVGPSLFGLNSLVEYDWQLSLGDNPLTEAEFAQLSSLKVPLVRIRGEWMELRPQEIEAAIKFFQKNRNREMTLAEALRLSQSLPAKMQPDVETSLPLMGLQAEGQIDEMLSALSDPGRKIEPVLPPRGFRGTLRPYQLRGVSWLEYLHGFGLGACLADDMGLGKTVELIAFLLRENELQKIEEMASDSKSPVDGSKPALLICPLSVAGNWQKEIERFAPGLRVLLHHGLDRLSGQSFHQEIEKTDIVITTYSLAQRDEEDLSSVSWSHVILDEAQSIKNQAARQTQSIKRLQAMQRIALTGTPVENRLSELWSIMDFLNPGYLGSSHSFRKDFVLPIEKYKNKERSDALRSIVQPFILRRLKTDPTVISDLPDKMELKVNYNLTPEQASLYAAVVEEMLVRIESSEGIERKGQILAALSKLKQICNHPALFLQDGSPLEGRSGKLSRLEEMLDEALAVGDRSLIFTQFAGMGAMLKHHLQEKLGVEALFLHGKTSRKQRDIMIQRFQAGDSPIFILSLKAGGFGLNLTAANHVFHFDRWWNPAVENQATDRAFRIGQKKNVFVHKFVCLGTLEEQIDQMIEQKKSLAESVIGTGEAWLTELSNSALKQMLSLRQEWRNEE
ncbi:RNA polymerase-associated protein RapA [uncultured archaeon]|nr:RNA polymerase-associated protein RapA [uncultured archaeon]